MNFTASVEQHNTWLQNSASTVERMWAREHQPSEISAAAASPRCPVQGGGQPLAPACTTAPHRRHLKANLAPGSGQGCQRGSGLLGNSAARYKGHKCRTQSDAGPGRGRSRAANHSPRRRKRSGRLLPVRDRGEVRPPRPGGPAAGRRAPPPGTALGRRLPRDPERSRVPPRHRRGGRRAPRSSRAAGPGRAAPSPRARAHLLYCAMRCTLALHVWMMPPKSRSGGDGPGR